MLHKAAFPHNYLVVVFVVIGSLFSMNTASPGSTHEFIVGDEFGWTILYNYTTWTQDKVFHVGDKLVFNYPNFLYNVFEVNETVFADCTKPPLSQALNSGNDVINLDSLGKKWFICGVLDYCKIFNQKLVVNVVVNDNREESLGKSSTGHSSSSSMSRHLVFVAVLLVLYAVLA